MADKDLDRHEKVSYSKYLFVLGSLFLFVSIWAVFNETFTRRTWKLYQLQFNHLEMKRVDQEIEDLKGEMALEERRREELPEGEGDLPLRRIKLKQEEAANRLETVQGIQGEIKKETIRFDDLKQEYQFVKADQGETYYEWKHAKESGHSFQSYKDSYYRMKEQLGSLRSCRRSLDR